MDSRRMLTKSCNKQKTDSITLLLASALFALTACSPPTDEGPMHTIALDQANYQVDQYIHSVVKSLPPPAALETNEPTAIHETQMPCTGDSSKYERYLRYAQRSYSVTGVDVKQLGPVFAAFHSWAKENGLAVDRTHENHPTDPVSRATDRHGFKVQLDVEYGHLFLGAPSPCVWRNGHPQSDGD